MNAESSTHIQRDRVPTADTFTDTDTTTATDTDTDTDTPVREQHNAKYIGIGQWLIERKCKLLLLLVIRTSHHSKTRGEQRANVHVCECVCVYLQDTTCK